MPASSRHPAEHTAPAKPEEQNMSTILHTATSVIKTCPAIFDSHTLPTATSSRPASFGPRVYRLLAGLYEGLAAYRQFERLQSWRVSREESLRQAFGRFEAPARGRPDIQR
jgi:hypothetical protein